MSVRFDSDWENEADNCHMQKGKWVIASWISINISTYYSISGTVGKAPADPAGMLAAALFPLPFSLVLYYLATAVSEKSAPRPRGHAPGPPTSDILYGITRECAMHGVRGVGVWHTLHTGLGTETEAQLYRSAAPFSLSALCITRVTSGACMYVCVYARM